MEPIDRRRASRTTTRVEVYDTLRASIVSLQRAPGQRLSEAELARDLGVSRTPVREAIIQLRADGLVEVTPQRGSFVSKISLRNVREAQFAREALECAAVRVAVDRIDDAAGERLRENISLQRAAQDSADLEQFYRLDEAFHRELVETSGYSGISELLDRSRAHLNRVRRLSLPVPDVIEELIDQHSAVVEAIERRDADAAEAALRHHLRGVYRVLEPLRDAHPDYFVPFSDGADGYEGEGHSPSEQLRERARTSGARVRHHQRGGLDAVTLENDVLRTTLLVGKGARVVEFLYKPRNIDLASWMRSDPPSEVSPDPFADGWWDVFPNGGAPSSYRGADFGEHGEVALLPWNVEVLEDDPDDVAVKLSVRTQRYPAYLEKVIHMNRDKPEVHVELSLQNLASLDLEAMWGCHLAFSKPFLQPGARLILEEGARVIPHHASVNENGRRRLDGSKPGRWPLVEGADGVGVDLSVLPDAAASEMIYVTGFADASYEIRPPNGGVGVRVAWDAKAFPYLWLWQEFGEAQNYPWWGQMYAVGMKPFSSYGLDGLTSAVENGSALRLAPHDVRTAWLDVTVAE
ncbi:MAG TPA: FCD domain-containing protein [Gaiellaceae bacterium]|nr:FCD domain-containing protein [Gaiellaceae bacterium]